MSSATVGDAAAADRTPDGGGGPTTHPSTPPSFDLGPGFAAPGYLVRSVELAVGARTAPVTLHDTEGAHGLARHQRARATTVGNRIAFAPGAYRPGTLAGDALIAHELAHAAAQRSPVGPRVQSDLLLGDARDERRADGAAGLALLHADRHAGTIQRVTGLAPPEQQALRQQAGVPRGRSGLRLTSCNGTPNFNYVPDEAGFHDLAARLHQQFVRLRQIREGSLPLAARADIDTRIQALVDELSDEFGVRLTPAQLADALTPDASGIDHLLHDLGAQIDVAPPGPHYVMQRMRFTLGLGLVPPSAPLEIAWRWSADGVRFNRFLITGRAMAERSEALTFELDEPFWNFLSPDVLTHGGFTVRAQIYVRGSQQPLTQVSTPFLSIGSASARSAGAPVRLRSSVRRAGAEPVLTDQVVTGTQVTFQVADWAPDLTHHDLVWRVDGQPRPHYAVITEAFSTVGEHRVAVEVYGTDGVRGLVGRDEMVVTVQEASVAAAPLLDRMQEQGLSALPSVRRTMDTSTAEMRNRVSAGGPQAALEQQRLDAQMAATGKVDEFTATARAGRPMSALQSLPADLAASDTSQSYTAPVEAVLVLHSTTEVQPLAMHLVTWHEPHPTVRTSIGDIPMPPRWHARLIDMTGAHVVKFDGTGSTALAATDAAFRDWRDDNTYPQRCTVVYRYSPPGWTFPQSFTTSTTEKEVLAWIDGILLVGGVLVGGLLLLVPEPTMATKALGLAVLAATVARSTYAIAQYRDLGYDWSSREVALEGISIVTSFVGLGGGALRQAGTRAASSFLLNTGRAMVIASAAADAATLVFLTHDAYRQLQAMQQDPTLNSSAREMATLRLISGLMLQGVMLVVSHRELFQGGLGRRPRFTERFGDPTNLAPEGHARVEMELTLMESGVAARDLPRSPRSLTDTFLAQQNETHASGQLDRIRTELPADRHAQFDRERAESDTAAEFLDHLSGDGTRDPRGFFLSEPTTPPVSGGTRGRGLYRIDPDSGASRPTKLNATVVKRFAASTSTTRVRMEGAELRNVTVPAPGADTFTGQLHLVDAGGNPLVVDITFHSTPGSALPRGPHGPGGRESGPARMEVTHDGSRYTADIYVDRDLHPTDAGDAIGHELDELAGLAHQSVMGEALQLQQRAGLMRPTTAARAPAATIHDRAQVREMMSSYNRGSGNPPARVAAMHDKLASWGLTEPRHLEARLEFLAREGVPPEVVAALRTHAVQGALAPGAFGGGVLPTDRIQHVLHPEGGSTNSLVGGGHLDSALQEHQVAHPDQVFVLVSQVTGGDGAVYRRYAQLRWTGGGTPPAGSTPTAIPKGSPGYPGVTGLTSSWQLSPDPKTTFTDPVSFLNQAQSAYAAWLTTNTPTNNALWQGVSPQGVHVEGRVGFDPTGKPTITTVYPDGAWVQ